MKKLSKIFVCIALVFGLTFSFTACGAAEVEENTKTVVETTTSIVPVEFTQATAEGIFNNALYNMLSSDKVQLDVKVCMLDGAQYAELYSQQKVLNQNGSRYVYLTDALNNTSKEYVFGTYNNRQVLIELDTNKYTDFTPTGDDDDEVTSLVAPVITRLDMIASTAKLSNYVVSGRYFDGATYINIKQVDVDEGVTTNVEVKIVDGRMVSYEMFMLGEDEQINGWATYTFVYGNSVDVSMIPTSLDGYTANA